MSPITLGIIASTLAGLATGVGALPALFFKNVPDKILNTMLGGAAGVMLAATSFSLIVPGIEYGNQVWPGLGVYVVVFGMLFGAVFLDRIDKWLPHEHFIMGHEGPSSSMKRIWLFIIAITIHNFPEGLAVGVGFGAGDIGGGTSLAIWYRASEYARGSGRGTTSDRLGLYPLAGHRYCHINRPGGTHRRIFRCCGGDPFSSHLAFRTGICSRCHVVCDQ